MSSAGPDRYKVLLDPVLALLDAIAATTGGADGKVRTVREFVEFKLYATLHLGDQIREQLQTPTSVARPCADGVIEVSVDLAARFALYVLVDGFLFESASIRDALFQFVNAVFNLGVAEDDPGFLGKIKERFQVTSTSDTGLEDWIEKSRWPPWLGWLLELRNVTTHRHPLRLPERHGGQERGVSGMPSHGRVGIACKDGSYEPLESFVERIEREVADLLRVSLKRLSVLHRS